MNYPYIQIEIVSECLFKFINSLWKTFPSFPPCEGGERGVVISSKG